MLHTFAKGMWNRKRRLLSTSMAVVLGVAFLVATLALGDTMRAGFDDLFSEANAGTAVVVRNPTVIGADKQRQRGAIDAGLQVDLQVVDGVAAVTPTIGGTAVILDSNGHRLGGNGPPTLGGNWITDTQLNPYRIAEGRPPADVTAGQPAEVVVDKQSATKGHLHVGDTTIVRTPEPLEVTVVGIATFGQADSLGPVTYAGFAEAEAARLFAHPGEVESFRIAAGPGVDAATLRARIASVLRPGIEAITGAQLTSEQMKDIDTDFLGAFRTLLLMFAVIAVVVAAFSINNTFSIVVAQRTRESALLRAVGGSRRQVLAGVVGEALTVGTVASAAGIAAGWGLAHGLKSFMYATGLDLGRPGVDLRVATIVSAVAVGLGVTFLASLIPAIRASRVSPMGALRDAAVDRSATSVTRAIAGTLLVAGGIGTVVSASSHGASAMKTAGLGALVTLFGAIVVAPVVARPVAGLLGAVPAALRGENGRLARRNAMRNPRRTAGSAAALMVGTAVVALFTTFGSSLKASINHAVDQKFAGDLVIIDQDFAGGGISAHVAREVAALPQVAATADFGLGSVRIDGHDEVPAVGDPARLGAMIDLDVTAGSLATMAPGELAVSTAYAGKHHLAVGSALEVGYADGSTVPMTVAVLYGDRGTLGTDVVMATEDWTPHAPSTGTMAVFVDLRPGVPLSAGQAAVDAVTERWSAPDAQSRSEYKATMGKQIDQMVNFIYGLLAIAVLIALMSIANTLSLSIHERTRELGLLRAVGQDRRQVRCTIRWESVIVAVFGTALGLGLGTFLGWGLMRALHAQEGFGIFAAPTTTLAVIVGVAAVAGVLAAIRPARRAAKVDILAAMATS